MKLLVVQVGQKPELEKIVSVCEKDCNDRNIEFDTYVLSDTFHGCTACGKCIRAKKCLWDEDECNEIVERSEEYDGLLVISDTFYGREDERMLSFVERLMRCAYDRWLYKPAAVLFRAKKENTKQAFYHVTDEFHYACMPLVTGRHMNTVIGEDETEIHNVMRGLYWLMESYEKHREEIKMINVDRVMEYMR